MINFERDGESLASLTDFTVTAGEVLAFELVVKIPPSFATWGKAPPGRSRARMLQIDAPRVLLEIEIVGEGLASVELALPPYASAIGYGRSLQGAAPTVLTLTRVSSSRRNRPENSQFVSRLRLEPLPPIDHRVIFRLFSERLGIDAAAVHTTVAALRRLGQE